MSINRVINLFDRWTNELCTAFLYYEIDADMKIFEILKTLSSKVSNSKLVSKISEKEFEDNLELQDIVLDYLFVYESIGLKILPQIIKKMEEDSSLRGVEDYQWIAANSIYEKLIKEKTIENVEENFNELKKDILEDIDIEKDIKLNPLLKEIRDLQNLRKDYYNKYIECLNKNNLNDEINDEEWFFNEEENKWERFNKVCDVVEQNLKSNYKEVTEKIKLLHTKFKDLLR